MTSRLRIAPRFLHPGLLEAGDGAVLSTVLDDLKGEQEYQEYLVGNRVWSVL
jgi:hypothetical protein